MNKTISDYMDICEKLSAERAALEVRVRELEAALRGLSAMYVHTWDRVDGDLVMMGDSVDLFEKAHAKAERVLAKALPCAWDRCDTPEQCAQRGVCRNLPKGSDGKEAKS